MSETQTGPRIAGVAPGRVVRPADLDGLRDVVCSAEAGTTLVPVGGGTRLDLGNPPAGPSHLLDLTQALAGDPEHNVPDMTVVAPAAVTVAALNALLETNRQRLPWDVAHPERATLGGVLAVGTNGPFASRYGQPRDHLLGATVLRADGELVSAGGRVVKNVTGYDLMRLWCGSLGTLGIFTSVSLRVYPVVETVDRVFRRPTVEKAVELAEHLYRADVRAEALEVIGDDSGWRLFARLPAPSMSVAESTGGWSEDPPEGLYTLCRDAGWRDADALTFYARTLPGHVASTASLLREKGALVIARPVTGTVVATWAGTEVEDTRHQALLHRSRDELRPHAGSVVVERMPDAWRGTVDAWGPPPESLPIMRRVKSLYDPGGTFNRGRFTGGI